MRTASDRAQDPRGDDQPRTTGFGRTTKDLPPRASDALPPPAPAAALQALDVQLRRNQPTTAAALDELGSWGTVQATAHAGVAGAGGPVPHADAIQPLMPGLDLSTVRAHQGAEAQDAAAAIGAQAYATGNDVALPAQPSRELVAHELAHVAQQRDGVHLAGGVGRAGDPYEREADAIAARVASGQSAADLMPAASSATTGAHTVQRQAADHEAAQANQTTAPADAAAEDPALAWIAELPSRMTEQIDQGFSAKAEHTATAKARKQDPDAAAPTGKKGVTWDEGRHQARRNFLSWGKKLLGSTAALRAHFTGLTKVSHNAYLTREAAARFEQASAWFAAAYPGSRFPETSVGQALRGRHQSDHGKGFQGHPLGISLDFDAYVNVDQNDAVASFMLKKFGGGPNQLQLGGSSYTEQKAIVQSMGKASAAGEQLSQAQLAYLDDAASAFDDMFATSERFKSALGGGEKLLTDVQALYYEKVQPGNQAVAALEKQLDRARKQAKKRVAKAGGDGDTEADPEVVALTAQRDTRKADFEQDKATVTAALHEAFAPWIASLEGEIAELEAHAPDAPAPAVNAKTLARVREQVAKADDAKELRRLLKKHRTLFAGVDPEFAAADFATSKAAAQAHADRLNADVQRPGEIKARLELIRRFTDPSAVFGKGVQDKGGAWRQQLDVSQPPIIQYLDKGFARNDELGTDPSKQGEHAKEVFNGEFVAAMMRFGFYPGAAWGKVDTMHFDFRDGFDAIQGDDASFGPG